MTLPVILRARAERDIREIYGWYESQQPGLGDEFLARLREALEPLRAFPETASLIHRNVRRVIVARFPYLVFYVIASGRVVVIAILHSSRDPAVWPRR